MKYNSLTTTPRFSKKIIFVAVFVISTILSRITTIKTASILEATNRSRNNFWDTSNNNCNVIAFVSNNNNNQYSTSSKRRRRFKICNNNYDTVGNHNRRNVVFVPSSLSSADNSNLFSTTPDWIDRTFTEINNDNNTTVVVVVTSLESTTTLRIPIPIVTSTAKTATIINDLPRTSEYRNRGMMTRDTNSIDTVGMSTKEFCSTDSLPYVEPDIARILLLIRDNDTTITKGTTMNDATAVGSNSIISAKIPVVTNSTVSDNNTQSSNTNNQNESLLSRNELIDVAIESDNFLFRNNRWTFYVNNNKLLRALIQLSKERNNSWNNHLNTSYLVSDESVTIALILALNLLESTIRKTIQLSSSLSPSISAATTTNAKNNVSSGKGAPLLKQMIQQLDSVMDEMVNNRAAGTTSVIKDNEEKNNKPPGELSDASTFQLSSHRVRGLLQGLLLPTGLNLRNMLWHGFIGTNIPRPWLALVIILIHQLQQYNNNNNNNSKVDSNPLSINSAPSNHNNTTSSNQQSTTGGISTNNNNSTNTNNNPENDTTNIEQDDNSSTVTDERPISYPFLKMKQYHPQLANVINTGTSIRKKLRIHPTRINHDVTMEVSDPNRNMQDIYSTEDVYSFIRDTRIIPTTHIALWDFCIREIIANRRPITVSILLTILLEHTLRILYCEVNPNRSHDQQARYGAYYITLDGHGQRHQHDLLLHPYQLHANTIATTNSSNTYNLESSENQQYKRLKEMNNQQVRDTEAISSTPNQSFSKRDQQKNTSSLIKNRLIELLGGNVVALLTDLFISGTDGPNLRSAMAHGIWDDCIEEELLLSCAVLSSSSSSSSSSEVIPESPTNTIQSIPCGWEVVDVLLCAIYEVAQSVEHHRTKITNSTTHAATLSNLQTNPNAIPKLVYRPLFSFTASTIDYLQNAYTTLEQLHGWLQTPHINTKTLTTAPVSVQTRKLAIFSHEQLNRRFDKLLHSLSNIQLSTSIQEEDGALVSSHISWTVNDVYIEHETNKLVQPLGATRSLLEDIRAATKSFVTELQNVIEDQIMAVQVPEDQDVQQPKNRGTTRQRNRMKRIVASAVFIYDLYSFAFLVAVCSLDRAMNHNECDNNLINNQESSPPMCLTDKEWIRAVERTRMVVSTVDNFVITNIDRSFKAADLYIQSQLIKKVIANILTV